MGVTRLSAVVKLELKVSCRLINALGLSLAFDQDACSKVQISSQRSGTHMASTSRGLLVTGHVQMQLLAFGCTVLRDLSYERDLKTR